MFGKFRLWNDKPAIQSCRGKDGVFEMTVPDPATVAAANQFMSEYMAHIWDRIPRSPKVTAQ